MLLRKILTLALVVVAGCAYSTQTRLPASIHSFSVGVFGNSTEYLSIEGRLTSNLIAEIGRSPRYTVVNDRADAELSGTIIEVRQTVLEYDANNQPRNMQTTIRARFSLFDRASNSFLIENREVSSSQSSTLAGRYYPASGDGGENAMDAALQELARVLVRSIMLTKTGDR
ncbi:hypothetical protein AGMMS49959_00930 [Planctomycetales bacterium]|nr:hypothetical protein AGMMS49959_00930 [Planctomycetales bacterium]